MPQPLPSLIQSQKDLDEDRIPRSELQMFLMFATSLQCISWIRWILKNVIWRGGISPRGEMIVNLYASICASTTMVLGREHELPIIVVSCIEIRAGIYQSNLFRTLPNRSRLSELINIEQQPLGSAIRSRHSSARQIWIWRQYVSLFRIDSRYICTLLSTLSQNPFSSQHFFARYGIGVDWKKTKLTQAFTTSYILGLPF